MAYRIVLRQDLAENWNSNNPTLLSGEFGFETDTNLLKLGNGIDPWVTLEYFQPGPTGPLDWSNAPATGGSPGVTGQIAYDYSGSTGHFYVCVNTNTWMRTTLTTF